MRRCTDCLARVDDDKYSHAREFSIKKATSSVWWLVAEMDASFIGWDEYCARYKDPPPYGYYEASS
jgi:hypothetical protein